MNYTYFDNAATTKLDDKVFDKMVPYFKEYYGNAAAIYKLGKESSKAIKEARSIVASIFNCTDEEIYFTSGGSESDNTAIKGIAYANKGEGNHIITSKIEHPAVIETLKSLEKDGFEVTYLNVDENGIVDLEELKNSIKDSTILISIMFANNEIGTIEPIYEIGKIAKEHGVYFHTDAVQAAGSLDIDVQKLNIDSLSISAHKFYGPKGIGALFVRKGIKFNPLINGGHQEKGKRAGTHNTPLIVGLAEALKLSYENLEEKNDKIRKLRDYYINEIEKRIPYIKINGDRSNRLPGNANISFKFIEGEGILLNLDNKGICASSGSACTSGSLDPSHVLLAIGLPHEIAHGSVRISIGKYNTKEEVDYLIDSLVEIVGRLRNMSPLYEEFVKGGNN